MVEVEASNILYRLFRAERREIKRNDTEILLLIFSRLFSFDLYPPDLRRAANTFFRGALSFISQLNYVTFPPIVLNAHSFL